MQFDEVPMEDNEDADPNVNIEQEIALEWGFMRCAPEAAKGGVKLKSDVSSPNLSSEDRQPRVLSFQKLHLLRLHVYIQLQSEARETEWRSMHITVPTSNGKLQYTVPVRTRPESPDGEWTVEIDPVSSVNTSVSPSEIH